MFEKLAAEKAKKDYALRRSLHQPMDEIWEIKKPRRPYDKAGPWEVDAVRRDPQGRFAAELPAAQRAAVIGGITTGSQIKPPVKKKRS